MILGMSLETFTLLHVAISLIAIVTGFVVVIGMIAGKSLPVWTALFLLTTVLTSVTGLCSRSAASRRGSLSAPSHRCCSLSRCLRSTLAPHACLALDLHRHRDRGVLPQRLCVDRAILPEIPFLHALAPTQSEPPFLITQAIALGVVIVLGTLAVARFRPGMPVAVG